MAIIEVHNVTKTFKVIKKDKGFKGSLKHLLKPEYEYKKAVDNISFNIQKGELVGYIGPNGAGKSTTVKMLSGILVPTEGEIIVNSLTPHKNRKENAFHIGLVFGQRSQLFWDLPMEDTFELYKTMYKIDDDIYKKNVQFYTDLMGMNDFLKQPVRQLSLGQKMRAELVISLLHNPDILYLDEPTIGLDVVSKNKLRDFIRTLNKEKNITVILTTHDMEDINKICDRIIMIDKGELIYDGMLSRFKQLYGGDHTVIADIPGAAEKGFTINYKNISIVKEEGIRKTFSFNESNVSQSHILSFLIKEYNAENLVLEQSRLEDVVRKVYES